MSVGNIDVSSLGNNSHGLLVGDVHNGEGILIEAEADLVTSVATHRTENISNYKLQQRNII